MVEKISRKMFVGGPSHGRVIETDDTRRDWVVYELVSTPWVPNPDGVVIDSSDRFHRYYAEKVAFNNKLINVLLHQQLSPIQSDLGDIVIDAMIKALDLEVKRD